jgi:DNA-binding CsgD family transcriptional regulator
MLMCNIERHVGKKKKFELTTKEKEFLMMAYSGLYYSEIALIKKCSESNVNNILGRTLYKIKQTERNDSITTIRKCTPYIMRNNLLEDISKQMEGWRTELEFELEQMKTKMRRK